MGLEIKEGYEYNKEIRELFTEYADLVIAGDKSFIEYLKMQHFDQEIEHLEEKYGYPNGRLYIAFYDGNLAGCIGLKELHNEVCEMKRLYVKPEFRGKHIGYSLAKKVIDDAKNIGYKSIVLDTFPFFKSAIEMYKKMGFYEIEQYTDSPMKDPVYLKLDL